MESSKPIYLDYNATTPVDPRVLEAMLPYLGEHFGNPSSTHAYGRTAREAVERARRQVATLLGCRPGEIIFTGSGSESNNLAIVGVADRCEASGRIVLSAIEHPAVTEVCRHLEGRGFELDVLPADGNGLVDPAALEAVLRPETILVTVMHANNEVGTIQPLAELARIARAHGVPLHSDAAQSVGKTPVRVDELGVDLLSVAGHKLYAPKGVGALFVRDGLKLRRQIHGADHERGLRAGTENVAGIVGLGAACEIAGAGLEEEAARLAALRDRLEAGIRQRCPEAVLNGHRELRLPNTLSLSLPGLAASEILDRVDGIAASAGSACHSEGALLSPVLAAMKLPTDRAAGTLRLSVGRFTTEDEIDHAATEIAAAALRLRSEQ